MNALKSSLHSALLLITISCLTIGVYLYCGRHIDELRNIDVNGVNLVYQVVGHADGKPVILLHGNSGSHEHLSVMAAQLDSAGYLVYAIDSRGQGANAPLEEYHYIDMAEDTYQFAKQLRLNKPAVFGWSDGGIIALQAEVLHPGTFGAIVTSGANLFPEGVNGFDEIQEALFGEEEASPLFVMMLREPQMTAEDMQTIQCPALIVAGENDLIAEEHTRMIASNIPNGTLLILPGEDHGSHIWQSPKMGTILIDYLKNQYK